MLRHFVGCRGNPHFCVFRIMFRPIVARFSRICRNHKFWIAPSFQVLKFRIGRTCAICAIWNVWYIPVKNRVETRDVSRCTEQSRLHIFHGYQLIQIHYLGHDNLVSNNSPTFKYLLLYQFCYIGVGYGWHHVRDYVRTKFSKRAWELEPRGTMCDPFLASCVF